MTETVHAPDPALIPAGDGVGYAVHDGLDLLTVKAAAAETGGALTVVAITTEPGGGPRPHTHPQAEVFFVIEGEVEFSLEREGVLEQVTARTGDIVAIPGGRAHGYTNHGLRARLLSVTHPCGMEGFFAELGQPVGGPTHPVDPSVFERHGVRGFPPPS